MNWDDDWYNPYRKRRPYWSSDKYDKYNAWKKWTTPERKELNDMIKKAWEKIEQWVPEREPDLTPSWSDIEKLYKHCEKLYKHIAVLHDDIERLKKKVILEPMLKRHRLTAKEKGKLKKKTKRVKKK